MRNFTVEEVRELYGQHTNLTGQRFTPEAIDHAFYLTQGQPLLVNALAKEIVEDLIINLTQSITVEQMNTAKEILIQRRDTHLDSLVYLLQSDRVKAVIEPILAGKGLNLVPPDDIQFLLDLGPCRMQNGGGLQIANPIYREIIPRMLAYLPSASLPSISPTLLSLKSLATAIFPSLYKKGLSRSAA